MLSSYIYFSFHVLKIVCVLPLKNEQFQSLLCLCVLCPVSYPVPITLDMGYIVEFWIILVCG